MPDNEPFGARKTFGDLAPTFVDLTDNVLFGQVWPRETLSPKLIRSANAMASSALGLFELGTGWDGEPDRALHRQQRSIGDFDGHRTELVKRVSTADLSRGGR